ncbi:hypothetical protein [Catellatospora chokoriensis]|uniref:NfeD integral membrane domain-containing protein n=1 Tax=Catellatospora chokoriensis TaxID=310353 RepID=A0A8J3JZ56_9ACTN|nr:hypothetical protein [Catellatospora chokoriensis]GIF93767.1 hypothetical protein Cch02nite_72110 [Catellatospora chokoriensis]
MLSGAASAHGAGVADVPCRCHSAGLPRSTLDVEAARALITFAAHVAAMAPGSTIGAATPVDAQTGQKASDKVIIDAAAFAESVAAQRSRDTGFAIDTVCQGRAVPATEAVRLGAVDLIASDHVALLKSLDGRTVTLADSSTVTLRTADAAVTEYKPGWARRLLGVLADPTLAFLFLSLGTLAAMYELAAPGHGFSGAIGVILLILGFFALGVLPVSVAGLAHHASHHGLAEVVPQVPAVGDLHGVGQRAADSFGCVYGQRLRRSPARGSSLLW